MKISRITLLLLIIFLLGSFLRFFKIQENFLFSAEQGAEYLEIKSAILARKLPLLGPPTSHPWLHFGPLYYWLTAAFLIIFDYSPVSGAYIGALIGSLLIFLNFWVVQKIFNQKVALFSSFLLAVSPLFIEFSRSGRHYFLVAPLFYLLFWLFYKIWQGETKFLFWAGLVFGAMLNFHLTPIVLTPTLLVTVWLKRKNFNRKKISLGFLGFLIPNLPFLISDFTHGFAMTTRFLLWIPYRIAGFSGFHPTNNFTSEVFTQNLSFFLKFFSESFVVEQRQLGILITLVIVFFIVFNFKKAFVIKKRENFGWFFSFWTLVIGLLILFVHGLPPKHYFVPLLPLPIIFFSLFLERVWKGYLDKTLILIFFLGMTFFNLKLFLISPSFYGSCEGLLSSFEFQKRVVHKIINDAQQEKFNLERVGEFDYYKEGYSQNYQYLAWLLGNAPSEEKAKLRYTIYEDLSRLPENIEERGELLKIDRIVILKEEVK